MYCYFKYFIFTIKKYQILVNRTKYFLLYNLFSIFLLYNIYEILYQNFKMYYIRYFLY